MRYYCIDANLTKIKEGGLGEFIPPKTTSAVAGMGLSKFRKLSLSPAYGFGL
jgi:hypothetical protein